VSFWLTGRGAAAINSLMEDAATAEISRTQAWQWVHRGAHFGAVENGKQTTGGEPVPMDLARQVIAEQCERLAAQPGADGERVRRASALFERMIEDPDCPEFLTLVAYQSL